MNYLINKMESVSPKGYWVPGLWDIPYPESLQSQNTVLYFMTSHCATKSEFDRTIMTQQFPALLLFAVIISRGTIVASYINALVQLMLTKHYFTNWTVNMWNSLPNFLVTAPSPNSF